MNRTGNISCIVVGVDNGVPVATGVETLAANFATRSSRIPNAFLVFMLGRGRQVHRAGITGDLSAELVGDHVATSG